MGVLSMKFSIGPPATRLLADNYNIAIELRFRAYNTIDTLYSR